MTRTVSGKVGDLIRVRLEGTKEDVWVRLDGYSYALGRFKVTIISQGSLLVQRNSTLPLAEQYTTPGGNKDGSQGGA